MSFTPIRPKKHLGQHFLIDEEIARNITDSLTASNECLLEIGPGTGVLTKYLVNKGFGSFKAVEIDREAVQYLDKQFNLGDNLILDDFLKMDLDGLFQGKFSIIGNFPYNISSQIFFKILDYRELVEETVGMLQKEVSQRIASPPGNKEYGILSVLLQAWYEIEYLFSVSEESFSPPPKVKSAVIRLKRNAVRQLPCDEKLFFKVVKVAFNQRRKTLHNALKPLVGYNGKYAGKRAEQLEVNDFTELTNEIAVIITK